MGVLKTLTHLDATCQVVVTGSGLFVERAHLIGTGICGRIIELDSRDPLLHSRLYQLGLHFSRFQKTRRFRFTEPPFKQL